MSSEVIQTVELYFNVLMFINLILWWFYSCFFLYLCCDSFVKLKLTTATMIYFTELRTKQEEAREIPERSGLVVVLECSFSISLHCVQTSKMGCWATFKPKKAKLMLCVYDTVNSHRNKSIKHHQTNSHVCTACCDLFWQYYRYSIINHLQIIYSSIQLLF